MTSPTWAQIEAVFDTVSGDVEDMVWTVARDLHVRGATPDLQSSFAQAIDVVLTTDPQGFCGWEHVVEPNYPVDADPDAGDSFVPSYPLTDDQYNMLCAENPDITFDRLGYLVPDNETADLGRLEGVDYDKDV